MVEQEIETLDRFPAWRQAVQDFLAEFKPGDMVPHTWLEEHFGMPRLQDSAKITAKDFTARQFAWLGAIEQFKAELLSEHAVLLWAVRGEGYRWVPAHEQTRAAMDALVKEARKVFHSAGQRLKNLRLDALTDDQRRENADACAKLASLRRMTRKQLK